MCGSSSATALALVLGGDARLRAEIVNYLRPDTDFQTFANETLRAANERYGRASRESRAIAGGWSAVGIDPVAPA